MDTAIARRLAALEAREAQLAALREHARWIRRTLLDAADRLRAARQRMIRRLAQAAIGLAQDEAERIQPAELRAGGVRAAHEHACDVVDRTTGTADDQLVEAHRAVRSRVRLVASQMPMPLAGAALEDRRNVVIHRLKTAAMDASETSRRIQADLDLGRNRLAAIEDEAASVDIAPVPTSTVEEEAALRPGHEITVAERRRADDAARETTASLARRAMTAESMRPGRLRRATPARKPLIQRRRAATRPFLQPKRCRPIASAPFMINAAARKTMMDQSGLLESKTFLNRRRSARRSGQ